MSILCLNCIPIAQILESNYQFMFLPLGEIRHTFTRPAPPLWYVNVHLQSGYESIQRSINGHYIFDYSYQGALAENWNWRRGAGGLQCRDGIMGNKNDNRFASVSEVVLPCMVFNFNFLITNTHFHSDMIVFGSFARSSNTPERWNEMREFGSGMRSATIRHDLRGPDIAEIEDYPPIDRITWKRIRVQRELGYSWFVEASVRKTIK